MGCQPGTFFNMESTAQTAMMNCFGQTLGESAVGPKAMSDMMPDMQTAIMR